MEKIPTPFRIQAIPTPALEQLRQRRVDVSGNAVEQLRAQGGEPLRCCLRNATPAEELLLCGYEPPIPKGPYREIGAIFLHATACAGPASGTGYPEAWRGKPQVLRAYDRRGRIHDARVHDGQNPEAEIARFLSDPEVEQLHSRNVSYGCFMFVVTREE